MLLKISMRTKRWDFAWKVEMVTSQRPIGACNTESKLTWHHPNTQHCSIQSKILKWYIRKREKEEGDTIVGMKIHVLFRVEVTLHRLHEVEADGGIEFVLIFIIHWPFRKGESSFQNSWTNPPFSVPFASSLLTFDIQKTLWFQYGEERLERHK